MPDITPCLWFDDQAQEAAELYVSVFPSSRIEEVNSCSEAGPRAAGTVMTVRFTLDGNELLALNGGPEHFKFDESISFLLRCASEEELDHYWSSLADGGDAIACGWLKDRYGLRWQVVPAELPELLADPDPARSRAAAEAMFRMKKLDLTAIKAAADRAGEAA